MTLIVVEGVDGAGKSTFIDAIQDDNPSTEVRHCGPLKQAPLIEYEAKLRDYDPREQNLFVCDRWHVGELVYGPLLRGSSKMTAAQFEHIELFLDSRGALKVHVSASLDTIMERFNARGDDLITPDTVPFIWAWYNRFLRNQHGWFSFNSERYGVNEIRSVVETADMKNLEVQFLSDFYKHYIGAPDVDVLIVADNPRDYVHKTNNWDAPFKPFLGSFSENFLTAAHKAQLPRRYGIAASNQPNLDLLLKYLSYGKIIAVGKKSWKAVTESTTDSFVSFPAFAGPGELVKEVGKLL